MEEVVVDEYHDIVIVGGGISGLATALALHRKGVKSVVMEKSETLRATGVGIIMQANGWKALDHLGVASSLRHTSIPIQSARYLSVSGGNQREIPLSGEMRCLKRMDVVNALAQKLPPKTIQFGRKVVSIQLNDSATSSSSPILRMHDGTILMAKIVIGCDGVNSTVANTIGLGDTKLHPICTVRGFTYYEKGHAFGNEFLIWANGNVKLGSLPISHNLVYWFSTRKWTSQDSRNSIDQVLIKESTMDNLKGFPNEIIEMVKNSDINTLHFTFLRYRAPWDFLRANFRRETVTVAGDAMHAMAPFLAQGGAASLEDAIVLARCLASKICNTQAGGFTLVKMAEDAIDEYSKQRKMRLFWLGLETYLRGATMASSSMLINFCCFFLLTWLFRNPNGHARYDCGSL